jgi:hypothetical protein
MHQMLGVGSFINSKKLLKTTSKFKSSKSTNFCHTIIPTQTLGSALKSRNALYVTENAPTANEVILKYILYLRNAPT